MNTSFFEMCVKQKGIIQNWDLNYNKLSQRRHFGFKVEDLNKCILYPDPKATQIEVKSLI